MGNKLPDSEKKVFTPHLPASKEIVFKNIFSRISGAGRVTLGKIFPA